MILFLLATALLILGYAIYGAFVERVFGASQKRKTPAVQYADGVDYVVLPPLKIFLIQFLNIAGLGPVFGAILGAVYGPVCLLWIVFGSIFAGAVHDYLSGMLSVRYKGRSMVFLVEKFFGKKFKSAFMLFMAFFLLLVGAVFAMNPAQMLASISPLPFLFWIVVIFGYYFLATLLPIDKIIGRFYPIFALLLLSVTISLLFCLFKSGLNFYPDLSLSSQNPDGSSIFPVMFVTIACGALSGFHATQSPMMARCLGNEKLGRPIFYGAMITEGFVALIWATLGIAFYQNSEALSTVINIGGPGGAISEISKTFLGTLGSILTVLSIVVLSITSGDTAFRSARLTLAECFKIPQNQFNKRLIISILVLSAGIVLSFFNLTKLWTYFGWANQCMATITLWVCTIYLAQKQKLYWITLIPASFMSVVCISYILNQKIGLGLSLNSAVLISLLLTALMNIVFFKSKPLPKLSTQ